MTTRDKLMRAAARLFAQRGYDGVSIRDIVAAAGANLGAVTYHFGGKENLFAQVLIAKVRRIMEIGQPIVNSAAGPEAKLRRLLRVWALHVLSEDPESRIAMAESVAEGHPLPPEVVEAVAWRNKAFADIVLEGTRRGVFRKCDVEHAAWCFFGLLSAYILYRPLVRSASRRGKYPKAYVERAVDTAVDLFLNGLRPRPSAPGRVKR